MTEVWITMDQAIHLLNVPARIVRGIVSTGEIARQQDELTGHWRYSLNDVTRIAESAEAVQP